MASSISPSVQIERDAGGAVRSLSHGGPRYGSLGNILNAQRLVEVYLRDVAAIYGIDPTWLNALTQSQSSVIKNAATEQRFGRQDLVYDPRINDRGEIAGNGVLPGVSTAPPDQGTMSRAFVRAGRRDEFVECRCQYIRLRRNLLKCKSLESQAHEG
jgi:hypothetical protein